MEPNRNQIGGSPERQMPSPETPSTPSPERLAPASPERSTETREAATGAGKMDATPAPQPVAPVMPAPAKPAAPTQDNATNQDNPVQANDDDIIEKEWVDKAKQIIAETKDNPYKQEQEVNRLQVDYMKKRYGRNLKSSGD